MGRGADAHGRDRCRHWPAFTDGWIEQQVRPNVRVALDPADLERGAREGAAMSLDEAVAYGLDLPVEELEVQPR